MKTTMNFMLAAAFGMAAATHAMAKEYIAVGTRSTLLMLQVNESKIVEQIYYGTMLKNVKELQTTNMPSSSAYSAFGGTHVNEAALRIAHSDGNTSTELRYQSHTTNNADSNVIQTDITLKDAYYNLSVTLHYRAYWQEDIIEQWTTIANKEGSDITIYNFASADLSFRAKEYYLTEFHGDWADEFNMHEEKLAFGTKIIDSKLGVRAHQYAHPCFLLALNGACQEEYGEVVGGALAYPGSFQMAFEINQKRQLRALCGMNPYASQYVLGHGDALVTPALIHTYSSNGAGVVSRRFHRWARKYGIKDGTGQRYVLLNNWEATYFDFDEPKLVKIIDDAAKMGFELFLLDDGWFGNKYPRNNDRAGLGDWQTNRKKLPHGIPFLINECKKRGIKFGIWIEPEMVNPSSELYERHPDWVIAQPHRDAALSRNQLLLDLSNPAVQEFVFNAIDSMLIRNPGVDYVKWDCNRFITNGGSQYLSAARQSHLWIDNANGALAVMERIAKKYPHIAFMECSGGGGRMDYGSMKYFSEYWISDNGDPLQRIFIQWGGGYFFPAIGMASHVSASPAHISGRSTPLKFRFDVAMAAKLGMDLQPSQMSAQDYEFSKHAIEHYKDIRPIVMYGDMYRLLSPYGSNRVALMYAAVDGRNAVVFSYLIRKEINGNEQVIYLRGLNAGMRYKITEINRSPEGGSALSDYDGRTFSGDYLMNVGLRFTLSGEYQSIAAKVEGQ
jgi:alpha-galactosidase